MEILKNFMARRPGAKLLQYEVDDWWPSFPHAAFDIIDLAETDT